MDELEAKPAAQQQSGRPHQDHIAAKESDGSESKIAIAPQIPPSPPAHPPTEQSQKDDTPRWRKILEFSALGLAVILALIYGGQLWVMKRQLKEMVDSGKQTDRLICLNQQQVDIARKANQQTHDLLASTQGAAFDLAIDFNKGSVKTPWIGFGIFNKGHSTARQFSGTVEFKRFSSNGEIMQRKTFRFADDTILAGSAESGIFAIIPWGTNEMDFQDQRFIVDSSIRYNDGFDGTQTQHFCREMVITQNQGPGWVFCGEAKDWEKAIK